MATAKTTKSKVKADTTLDAAVQDARKMTETLADNARELVKRTTETAKERTDGLYASSKKYNSDLEGTLTRAADGYVNFLGSFADVLYANASNAISTAEKLAEAKSLSEAVQIQADYLREQSAENIEHARNAAGYVQDVMTENASRLRDSYEKAVAEAAKAA